MKLCAALAMGLLSAAPLAHAVLYDGADGATCTYYNAGAWITWRNRQGDWIDAHRESQGSEPYAQARVGAGSADHVVRFDVTRAVREWQVGRPNDGFLITVSTGGPEGGAVVFHSRESADEAPRPRLVLRLADGMTQSLSATADTTLDCTTYTSLGQRDSISASRDHRALVQFDIGRLSAAQVASATLELTVLKAYGDASLALFVVNAPLVEPSDVELGIAARYRADRGIRNDPAVLMATGFDTPSWRDAWSYVSPRSVVERVTRATALGFEPLDGAALMVNIPAGSHLGLDIAYRLGGRDRAEPDEVYFRYYVRFGSDWLPTLDGGKLPGISGTYGRAGWGGRRSSGYTGWSMRGSFQPAPSVGNPYEGRVPMGTYAYHSDMKDDTGDAWQWSSGGQALLERSRWYCIEQYFKLNHLGERDGVLRAWVDGRLVFERTGIHVRDVPSIRIEQIWMNVYFGGRQASPTDLHLFIDNVVVARRYIGPMAR